MALSSSSSSAGVQDLATHELRQMLHDVQLDQFLPRLRDDLQVTKLCHFDYVRYEDLERIGLGRPAARRLLDAVKKRRAAAWRKAVVAKFLPGGASGRASPTVNSAADKRSVAALDDGHTALIREKDIVVGTRLGDGSFGVVREGDWHTPDGKVKKVAIKVLKVDVVAVTGALEDFMREVTAMTQLTHNNLIRLYGIVLGKPLMMVTELAALGSLLDKLRSQEPPHVTTCCTFVVQVCAAMRYLESRRCIHRDLAARNVFLASEDTAKLGDFGLTRSLSQSDDCYVMTEPKKVPFPWCAPESLKAKTFSHASDMWMFGVTVWEMFSRGEEPWAGLNGGQILRRVEAGERLPRPQACPAVVYALISEAWQLEPQHRPSFSSAYERLLGVMPAVVEARQRCSSDGKLLVEPGDSIAVIDGSADHYWWVGENLRTRMVGEFPRCIVDVLRPLTPQDISSPLMNSFIHAEPRQSEVDVVPPISVTVHSFQAHKTAQIPAKQHLQTLRHGGTDKSWGHPSYIDEMYLRNPMSPPDKERQQSGKANTHGVRKQSVSPRKVKHQSLRLKPSSRTALPPSGKLFQYNRLNYTKNPTPRDIIAVDTVPEEDGQSLTSRQRSYSIGDLRKGHHGAAMGQQQNSGAISASMASELRGSVSSLSELPSTVSSDNVGAGLNHQTSGSQLVPVRPSPAPPVNKTSLKHQQLDILAGANAVPPPAPNIYSNSFEDPTDILPAFGSQATSVATYGNFSVTHEPIYYNNVGEVVEVLYDEPPAEEQPQNDVAFSVANDVSEDWSDDDDASEWSSIDGDVTVPAKPTVATVSTRLTNEASSSAYGRSVEIGFDFEDTSETSKINSNSENYSRSELEMQLSARLSNLWLDTLSPKVVVSQDNSVSFVQGNIFNQSDALSQKDSLRNRDTDSQRDTHIQGNFSQLEENNSFSTELMPSAEAVSSLFISADVRPKVSVTTASAETVASMTDSSPRSTAFARVDASFMQELEKRLGVEHATANTFQPVNSGDKVKSVQTTVMQWKNESLGSHSSSNLVSNNVSKLCNVLPVQRQLSASISTTAVANENVAFANFDLLQPLTPATKNATVNKETNLTTGASGQDHANISAESEFSSIDIDVVSKTLGLQTKSGIDTRKFFPKNTAAVRPFMQTNVANLSSQATTNNSFDFSASQTSLNEVSIPRISGLGSVNSSNLGVADINGMNLNGFTPSSASATLRWSSQSMSPLQSRSDSAPVNFIFNAAVNGPSSRTDSTVATPSPLTAQELAEFASPPSTSQPHRTSVVVQQVMSQQQQQQQFFSMQQLPLQYQLQLQQIQLQHMQNYGHPLSMQQLRQRLLQMQEKKQQELELQQKNLQQIQQLRQQQLLQQEDQKRQSRGGLPPALQPTVVLSPQVTVNYNQSSSTGPSSVVSPPVDSTDTMVARVATLVPGCSMTEARQALLVAHDNFQGAVQFLKVERLYRLGVANKADCEQVLEENNWELTRSASHLLDKFS